MDEKDTETKSTADNAIKDCKYNYPPIDLLKTYAPDKKAAEENVRNQESRKEIILCILKNAGIEAEITDIKYGAAVTRFELSIPSDISLNWFVKKLGDLDLRLAAKGKIRIVAPIPGTLRIGIEVPNGSLSVVGLKEIIESDEFKGIGKNSLCFCLGKNVAGSPVIFDFRKMPHLLVAGATGTGKSVFLNTMIVSLLYKYSPEDLRIILVDPKYIVLNNFRGIPNLMFDEMFTDTAGACSMLEWAIGEMQERYKKLNAAKVRNIDEYNVYMAETHGKKMPRILIIIDEFADLMASSRDRKLMKNKIGRLAAKTRAAGIHLVMATQRPSADIMEGPIKDNFVPCIAFRTESSADALIVMGESGAEKLLGMGDLLYRTWTTPALERAQGCFISTEETEKICDYLRDHNECHYDELALKKIEGGISAPGTGSSSSEDGKKSSGKSL